MRSRAAASILSGAGLNDVHSMEGGINAWKGLRAEGLPDAGTAYFSPGTKPEELMALAWYLEKGSHTFYAELSHRLREEDPKDVFKELAAAEERHQAFLTGLVQEFSRVTPDSRFPEGVISPPEGGEIMEGGMRVAEALGWAEGKNVKDILELAVSLETNAYDLHLRMGQRMEEKKSKEVFTLLSKEEKDHLERLSSLLEERA